MQCGLGLTCSPLLHVCWCQLGTARAGGEGEDQTCYPAGHSLYEDYYDRGFDKRRLDLGSESDYDYLDDTGRTNYYRRLNRKLIVWN